MEASSGTLPQASHEYQSPEGVGVMSALDFLRQLGLIVEVRFDTTPQNVSIRTWYELSVCLHFHFRCSRHSRLTTVSA